MKQDNDIVYFELNNWFAGIDFPNDEPFLGWMCAFVPKFRKKEWVEQERLVVVSSNIDMSQNFCITATKEWVQNNCPKLLTDYKNFLRFEDEDGYCYGRFGCEFLPYKEENIGVHYDYEDY